MEHMFETKRSDNSLQTLPNKAEAYLSDLFFILYFIHLAKVDQVNLHKGIVYVLEELGKKNKLDEIKFFNLSFYRYKFGDYNKAIPTEYIPALMRVDLIEESNIKGRAIYQTTKKASRLLEKYDKENIHDEDVALVKQAIKDYTSPLKEFFEAVRFSHGRTVLHNGIKKTVDDLEEDEHVAIAYNASPEMFNSEYSERGTKASIFPTSYLLALNSLLEENKIEKQQLQHTSETKEVVEELMKGVLAVEKAEGSG